MIQINQQVTPTHPDGWHFWDDDVRLSEESYQKLVYKVTEYRIAMRKDWQMVQQEINEYIASISPTSVAPSALVNQVTERTLADKVYNWLSRTYDKVKNSPRYSSQADAMNRASACKACPFNKTIPPTCGLCMAAMRRMGQGITKSRKCPSVDNNLGGCDLLFYDLKTAIHLEDDILGSMSAEEKSALPERCWRRK